MKDYNNNELNVGDYVITWVKCGSQVNTVDGIISSLDKGHVTIDCDLYKSGKIYKINKLPWKVIKAIKL